MNRREDLPDDVEGAESPQYKDDVALNGSPMSANAALTGRVGGGAQQGWLAEQHQPGINFFKQLEVSGNFNSTDCNSPAVIEATSARS